MKKGRDIGYLKEHGVFSGTNASRLKWIFIGGNLILTIAAYGIFWYRKDKINQDKLNILDWTRKWDESFFAHKDKVLQIKAKRLVDEGDSPKLKDNKDL